MDYKAIATAIATTVGTVTVNGQSVTATAQLPNQIATIALLVYPPTGQLEIGVGRMRNDHYNFPLRLLLDPLDMPSRSDALYDWSTALRDLVEMNMDLGLAYVAQATVDGMRLAIDGEKYANVAGEYVEFDLVELNVRVLVRELVPTVGM